MKTSLNTLFASLIMAIAGLSFVASPVMAADPEGTLNSADQTFVKTASQHGLGEVQIAALGIKKSAREDVKSLAEKIVADHTAANAELATLAKSKGVMISVVTDPADTEVMKDLENTDTGKDFDAAFLEQLEDDHQEAISLYEDAAEDSKDAEVKAWAAKTLPTLREHLNQIQALMKK